MKKTVFVFSSIILAMFILFKLSTYSLNSGNLRSEIIIGIIASIFFFIGLWINKSHTKPTAQASDEIDESKIKSLGITAREHEVLKRIAEGLSNKEIGNRLFLSESTVKTHVSNILLKLNAKRRTQAIQIAKKERIL